MNMTTPTREEEVRQQFEAWAKSEGLDLTRARGGDYLWPSVQYSFIAYKAALEAALAAQPAERQGEDDDAATWQWANSVDIPAVARLYYTGVGTRRYKRASTQSGPGEPLCFVSTARELLRRQHAAMSATHPAAPVGEERQVAEAVTDKQVAAAIKTSPELDVLIDTEPKACIAFAAYRLGRTPAAPVGVPDGLLRKALTIAANMRTADWLDAGGELSEQDALADYLAAAPSAPQGNAGLGIPSCGKPLCSENDHHPLCPSAPQGVECQHSWVTDGINPTCCSKCKRPAMPTHHTERKWWR